MSLRYPTVAQAPWLPHKIDVLVPGTGARDVYGQTTGQDTVRVSALCEVRMVELMEKGARAVRQGVSALVPGNDFSNVGTEFTWNGQTYTVVGITAKPDQTGTFDCFKWDAVVKAGTPVQS